MSLFKPIKPSPCCNARGNFLYKTGNGIVWASCSWCRQKYAGAEE